MVAPGFRPDVTRPRRPAIFAEDGTRLCGAKRTRADEKGLEGDALFCHLEAGFGTDHPGYGKCKWHMGCTPSGKTAAFREEMEEMLEKFQMGSIEPIDPADALLQAVWRAHGWVKYLEMLAAKYEYDDPDLVEVTEQGTRPRAWIDVYTRANMDMAKCAEMCLRAGVNERKVRLAEQQGELVARTFLNMLGELELTPDQKAKAPALFRRHMLAMGSVLDVESEEVAVGAGDE